MFFLSLGFIYIFVVLTSWTFIPLLVTALLCLVIPYLSVTIKRLTRYKHKEVLAAMLEGKSMPSNMAANTNHTTLLKNQSAIKYLP